MKVRSKLIVSFCIMVILPVILCVAVVSGIFQVQTKSINQAYDVECDTLLSGFYSSTAIMGQITERIYENVAKVAYNNPEKFNDSEYLNDLSARLEKKMSSIVVRKNGELLYTSSELGEQDMEDILPQYDGSDIDNSGEEQQYSEDESNNEIHTLASDNNTQLGIYTGGKYQLLIKQIDFTDNGNNEYSVYIITSLNQVIPQVKHFVIQGGAAILTILIITGVLLTLWVYSSILKPVDKLKLATNNIKNGNLDFKMPKVSNDEIGDVCRDFEEMRVILKQSSEDKIKSDKEEKELIRNISHDLKTPLTAIKGYVEGILDGIADTPEKQEKYLRTIANKVNDMDKLIDELTIYSKLDTNRVPYSFNKINAKAYFDDCCDEIHMDLDAQGITLNYNYHASDDMYIVADAEQLKRVINNIVSNSAKYLMDGRAGIIDFDIYDEGDYAHIIIRDNGKGIGINELPHIFERFYRTDSSRNSKKGGSGIGLAIVKKIIDDHKGRIWAESVEGEGTTMHIDLKKYKDESCYCIENKNGKDKNIVNKLFKQN